LAILIIKVRCKVSCAPCNAGVEGMKEWARLKGNLIIQGTIKPVDFMSGAIGNVVKKCSVKPVNAK